MRWAPSVYAAVDKIRDEERDREALKQKTQQAAQQPSAPRFSGHL